MDNRRRNLVVSIFAALIAVLLAALPALAAQEVFTLKNGSVITGEAVGEANGLVNINTQYGIIAVPANDIVSREPVGQQGGGEPAGLVTDQPLRLAGSNTVGASLI